MAIKKRSVADLTTSSNFLQFFSVQVLFSEYSYSRGGGMELISDTETVVVAVWN